MRGPRKGGGGEGGGPPHVVGTKNGEIYVCVCVWKHICVETEKGEGGEGGPPPRVMVSGPDPDLMLNERKWSRPKVK